MEWKAKIILKEVIGIEPTQKEIEITTSIIDGGKSNNSEKALTICAYFDKTDKEEMVYNKLCALAK